MLEYESRKCDQELKKKKRFDKSKRHLKRKKKTHNYKLQEGKKKSVLDKTTKAKLCMVVMYTI